MIKLGGDCIKDISKHYFHWLMTFIADIPSNYSNIINYLYARDFNYILSSDGNRYEDGISLRYRFGTECGVPDAIISSEIDNRQCTMLEMMIALANRAEVSIMYDPAYGNRTSQWFIEMIDSLGLSCLSDENYFDVDYADTVIENFVNRRYSTNGRGGLFTIQDSSKDMTKTEIWYQMLYYMNER